MTHDPVSNPSHYNQNGIEVIDVIETYVKHDFRLANVIKYVCRHSYKGKPIEDLRKARWYLDRAIADMEAEACRELTELGAALYDNPATPDTFVIPVITDIHEPDNTYVPVDTEAYVCTSPDRIAGDCPLSKSIKAKYYDYIEDEVIAHCANCGEPIMRCDLYIQKQGFTFCSTDCAEEFTG